jgi:PAS domain S-box-containing protein
MITARDITETQTIESALRISEDRLKMALDAANVGIWQWDILSDSVLWSGHSESIVGVVDGAEMTFDKFLEKIHPEDRDRARKSLQAALDEKLLCDLQYRMVGPDGSVRLISAKGQGYYNVEGAPTRMEGIVLDVTGSGRQNGARP